MKINKSIKKRVVLLLTIIILISGVFNFNVLNVRADNFIEAENCVLSNCNVMDDDKASGGKSVGFCDDGDYIIMKNVNMSGMTCFITRAGVSPEFAGQTLEIRLPDGTMLGSMIIQNTGAWTTFTEQSCTLSTTVTGITDIHLKFVGTVGVGNFDWFLFSPCDNTKSAPYAEFTFTGTYISYVTETYNDEGLVNVYMDGRLDQTINCYSQGRYSRQAVYTRNLSYGTHTIKIEKVSGTYILLDSFVYLDEALITVNDTDQRIKYSKGWYLSSDRQLGDYNNDVHYAVDTPTNPMIGKRIKIQMTSNNFNYIYYYICKISDTVEGGKIDLHSKGNLENAEIFLVEDGGNGTVFLKAISPDGTVDGYLTVNTDSCRVVINTSLVPGNTERFELENFSWDGTYTLKSLANGKFLCIDAFSGFSFFSNSDTVLVWEILKFFILPDVNPTPTSTPTSTLTSTPTSTPTSTTTTTTTSTTTSTTTTKSTPISATGVPDSGLTTSNTLQQASSPTATATPALVVENSASPTRYPAVPDNGIQQSPTPEANGIPDWSKVPSWAREAVLKLLNKHIISGDEHGNINPNSAITRNELPKVLDNLLGLKPNTNREPYFKDNNNIPGWVVPYLNTALDYGLIKGYDDNSFKGAEALTRAQAIAGLMRVMNKTGKTKSASTVNYTPKDNTSDDISKFSDFSSKYWAANDLRAAFEMGLIKGYPDNTIKPDKMITRAEFFTIVAQVI